LKIMDLYAAMFFVLAALCALAGTNSQAAQARAKLFADDDPRIMQAARSWRPIRWPWTKTTKQLRAAEALFADDEATRLRYQSLCRELFAWNSLETSVALALPATVIVLIQVIRSAS
jgi:hypothetical protein